MSGRVLVLGGGVIGLAIAWESLRRGLQVTVIERGDLEGQASPAGAGILVPGNAGHSSHPLDRMAGRSTVLHCQWNRELLEETGLDSGLIPCGGVYLALADGEAAALGGQASLWQEEQVESFRLTPEELGQRLGECFSPVCRVLDARFVPGEMQVDNIRLLNALQAAIRLRGGEARVLSGSGENSPFQLIRDRGRKERILGLSWSGSFFPCDWIVLAAGAWSGQLAPLFGWQLRTTPIRGQMVLFRLPNRPFVPVVNLGSRYLVPRADGDVLAGSTMEEAGFDPRTTHAAIDELQAFAASLFPVLGRSKVVRTWAGLRPATFDGLPRIGWIPGCDNALVATGHLRSGLQLSTATAQMVNDLIEGKPVDAELQRILHPAS